MKIAFLIRTLTCGGAERQLILLATGLRRVGHEVSVHVFYPNGELERELLDTGVQVRNIGKNGRWESFGFLLRALKSIRGESPDVVHGYMHGANVVTALLKCWLKPARIVWGVRSSRIDFRASGWLSSASAKLESRLSESPHLIISNSRSGLNSAVQRGFPRRKLVIVPNGVDLNRFQIDLCARERVRQQWNCSPDDLVIGRAGRLDPVKDYPTFLRAAALALKVNPRLRFVCIGSGPDEHLASLRRCASDLGIAGKVIFTGLMEDMEGAYNALDLFASTSTSEGFPNVLLEAMACGLPCVSTSAGDAEEILQDLGVIVPPRESPAIASAFIDLLSRTSNREAIRESIVRRYSPDLLVERSEAHLKSLFTEGRDLQRCRGNSFKQPTPVVGPP